MGKSFANGVKYGLFAGLFSILLTVVLYVINPELIVSFKVGLVSIIMLIVFMTLAARATRKSLGGYMNFGQAFIAAIVTVMVSTIISQFFTFIMFNFIDPELVNITKEYTIELTVYILQSWFSAGQEQIDQTIEELQKADYSMGLTSILTGLFSSLVMSFIPSLLVAAVTQKRRRDPYAR